MTVSDLVDPDSSGCPSGDSELGSSITDILSAALGSAAKGAAGAAGSDLFGWALSAMGIGGSDTSSQILSELQEIETTLVDICNELAAIDTELQKLVCATDADWLTEPASAIDTWYADYMDYVTDAQFGAPPSQEVMQVWVDEVLDADTGALHAITQLKDFGTASTSSGSIADCIQAQTSAIGAPDSESLDDRPYYEAIVAPIQNWFYGYNTIGYTVLVEAYHYQAWVDAGSPSGDIATEIPDVCTTSSGGTDFNCVQAQTVYNVQVLPWLEQEIAVGGAPYSTDDYVMVNGWQTGSGAGWWLIATNLEAYTEAAGGDCASPLTSTDLCGPLVGNAATFEMPSVLYGSYGASGYGKWETADAKRFDILLKGLGGSGVSSSTTVAAWLCNQTSGSTKATDCSITTKYGIDAQGLEHADKIVAFNQQTSTDFGKSGLSLDVWCFVDGAITRHHNSAPYCGSSDGSNVYGNLLETHNPGSAPSTCPSDINQIQFWMDDASWTRTNGPVSNHEFYEGTICVFDFNQAKYAPSNPPDYGVVDTKGPKSYHWPIVRWTDLTCSNALDASLAGETADQAANPGGVPTMCGQDYALWLADLLPIVE